MVLRAHTEDEIPPTRETPAAAPATAEDDEEVKGAQMTAIVTGECEEGYICKYTLNRVTAGRRADIERRSQKVSEVPRGGGKINLHG